MIDQWLKKDLDTIFKQHSVAVFIDESSDGQFLLKTLGDEYSIHEAHSELEELHVKYLLEKEQPASITVIYTTTPKEKLKFIREYCETNGCVEIRYLQNYIKDKVHQTLNLNINLPQEELIAAAKMSVGKDRTYWMDLSHKGASEIFNLEKELLPFLHEPTVYAKEKYDEQLRKTFFCKVSEHLNREYLTKPPETLAAEVVTPMFDGLIRGDCDPLLFKVYCSWLDSVSYKKSFNSYLSNYTLPADLDIWQVSPAHPFKEIDEMWLKEIGENIHDKDRLPGYLAKITQRGQNKQALSLGITFWQDVKALLEFDSNDISYLSSFTECVAFYTRHFYLLDSAIRGLYTEFFHQAELLKPFQEYYKTLVSIFLDKWFQFFGDYQNSQTGLLQRIIAENSCKTAIIVGDGVTFEIAQRVNKKVSPEYKVVSEVILADIPSETENNMSRIYIDNGETESVQDKREKYLQQSNPDRAIEFIQLDNVKDEEGAAQYCICTSKDIDTIGENLQHSGLKYFQETENLLAEKIETLLGSGYQKVFLVSDHGFVLTGLLDEADKISVTFSGQVKKAERYIRTVDQQQILPASMVEIEKSYEEYNYLYFSKTMNPFKTTGKYGFSHGGLSAQELITPCFCWENPKVSSSQLPVTIGNKNDLKSVTGELCQIKLIAGKGEGDLFNFNRKVYLVFFSNGRQVSKSDIITIQTSDIISKEFAFDGLTELEAQLLDAQSKEQLDLVTIKQNKDRDLGGLL